jgi:hypothetical protein
MMAGCSRPDRTGRDRRKNPQNNKATKYKVNRVLQSRKKKVGAEQAELQVIFLPPRHDVRALVHMFLPKEEGSQERKQTTLDSWQHAAEG